MPTKAVLSGRSGPLVAAASVVILFAGCRAMAPILSPVLLALLLALVIRPLVDWLARRGLGRGLTILVSFAAVLGVGLAVISLVGVSLGRLGEALPVYEGRLDALLGGLQARLAASGMDLSHVVSAERVAGVARKLLSGLSSVLSGAMLILLLVVLFVVEMPLLDKLLDRGGRRHWAELTAGIQRYIALTGLLGLVNALLNLVLLLILGVDFAVLWTVTCFFLNFVPAVGNLLALTPPALLALLESGWQRAVVVVVGFFVTNMLVDLVVKPKLMKTSLDISPLVVILSLMLWGWVLGPAGPILAIPLTMVVRRLLVAAAPAAAAAAGS
jgi:predicted PurR-regulated permease PerM